MSSPNLLKRQSSEVFWVAAQKGCQFTLQLLTLKVMTNLLSKEDYGDLQLVIAGLGLLSYLLIMPVQSAYLRSYHRAATTGLLRPNGLYTYRWYAIATGAAGILILVLPNPLELSRIEALAAGLLYVGIQWRLLAQQVANNSRERRYAAIQSTLFLVTQLGMGWLLVWICPTLLMALIGYMAASLGLGLVFVPPMIRQTCRAPATGDASELRHLTWTYGVPAGLLMCCQWMLDFADRFVLEETMGPSEVGEYVAAYQVCGIPFIMMWFFMEGLLVPIMYQRAADVGDPRQLWSAYKALLLGVTVFIVSGLVAILGYVLFGQRLMMLMTNEDYKIAINLLIVLALCRFVQNLSRLLDTAFSVHQSMRLCLTLRVLAAAFMIPVCWVLITRYQLLGAALGSLAIALAYLLAQLLMPRGVIGLIISVRREISSLADIDAPPSGGQTE